ncbi:hypothetical protein DM02DRAFT_657131 [Periconia macrospinosa]|uniref:Uncharacterized protein n=1 Tax=Periconia macrospinosa TaxID=97972 RepID=A0A2V1DK81_9PLEO|nr:hypothetical protein DM02DRAFT_657131 [Periconia macrospinosa]
MSTRIDDLDAISNPVRQKNYDIIACVCCILDSVINATHIWLTGYLPQKPHESVFNLPALLEQKMFPHVQELVISSSFISLLQQEMPRLQSLDISDTSREHLELVPRSTRHQSSLRFRQNGFKRLFLQLSAYHGVDDPNRLRELIVALGCSAVEDLTLEIGNNRYYPNPSFSLRAIVANLQPIAQNLRKFELIVDPGLDFYEGVREALASFTSLSTLIISLECLFDLAEKEGNIEDIECRLPACCSDIVLCCSEEEKAYSLLEEFCTQNVPAKFSDTELLGVHVNGPQGPMWKAICTAWADWNFYAALDESGYSFI